MNILQIEVQRRNIPLNILVFLVLNICVYGAHFFTLIHISKPLLAANDEKETKNESKKKICYLLGNFGGLINPI